ncbi:MAG TPA: hypothetical protein VHQ87_09875, partial [Rhizobacter sp.]|nr:hypothetical protein [Rhizobacter sp.]
MTLDLRARFGPTGTQPKPRMAGDFVFSPADYPSMRGHQIEHEELDLLEFPLAVERRVFLSQGSDTLRLEFALCLQGFGAAVDLLFHRAAAFQREPLEHAVVDLARTEGVGDVGFAWAWGDRDGEAGFVRHNVMVFLHGRHETLLQQAREIDAALVRQATTAQAAPEEKLFAVGDRLAVSPGDRVDLGVPSAPEARHFFMATGGSVNLDPIEPARHYYRAGLRPGNYLIEAYRVGRGLLPAQQTLRVTVTEG